MPPERAYEVPPDDAVRQEIEERHVPVDRLVSEAVSYLNRGDGAIDDLAVARMFIERGHSEQLAHWIVREAEVRRAPR